MLVYQLGSSSRKGVQMASRRKGIIVKAKSLLSQRVAPSTWRFRLVISSGREDKESKNGRGVQTS